MKFPFSIISQSEYETGIIAKQFTKELRCGDLIALNGDLGTGKTYFVKKICEELKIDDVTSPTFSILNEYKNSKLIFHFDFYRIKKMEELFDIGIDEYLNDTEAIKFIEWADLMPEILPEKYYEIKFRYIGETAREINIKHNG